MRLWEMYNIPRNKMPQINKKHLEAYPKTLQVVDIASVTPSQSDRVPGLVDKTLKAFKAGEKELMDKPMVVDRDLNIVNGHHRFDALKKMGMTKVPVLKVDATLPELIDDFSHTTSDRPVKEVKYTEPKLDVEWEEANRYPYLADLGQAGWIELAKQGKAITVDSDSVKKIGNTGADGSETLDDLEPDKVDRLTKAMQSGKVEMPIVIKQPNGSLELVAGNTRLIGLINKLGKAVVWYVDASNTVSDKPVGEAQSVKLSDKEIGDVKLGTGENLWLVTYNNGSTKKVVAQSKLGVRKQLKEPDGKYKKPAEPSNYELGIRRIEKVSMPNRRPDTSWTKKLSKKKSIKVIEDLKKNTKYDNY